jgi:microcystin-dependent protein
MSYKPAIGQINLQISSYEDITNIPNINIDTGVATGPAFIDKGVSPLAVTRYALFNALDEENNFGLDDVEYLKHTGGFITQDSRVNIKKSDFTITGTLTVEGNTRFYKGINMGFKQIYNTARLPQRTSPSNFATNPENNNAVAVGDVREFAFRKGMIMLWSGTREELYQNLPYWRLCGPPDSNRYSGGIENGVEIPNLEGRFVVGAGYAANNNNRYTLQYLDSVTAQSQPPSVNLSIGTTGGHHAWTLTLDEIPAHIHNVLFRVEGGEISLTSSADKTILYKKDTGDPNRPSGWISFSSSNAKIECLASRPAVSCWCTGACVRVCDRRCCFPGGTKISTPAGSIDIENIKESMVVNSFNHTTGSIEANKVKKIFKHNHKNQEGDQLIKITHESGDVTLTKNHWVYTDSGTKGEFKKYIDAGDLIVGNYLITSENKKSKILNIEEVDEVDYVYNFEVEENHNFIASNVKVHNGGKGKGCRCVYYGRCGPCSSPRTCNKTYRGQTTSISSITQNNMNEGTFSVTKDSATGGISSQDDIGNDVAHENMPPYYSLAYIIYVGKERESYIPGGGPLI